MKHLDRRAFLLQLARTSSLAALATAFPTTLAKHTTAYPFRLGVASGSPRPNGMVLWTRLVSEPLQSEPIADIALPVGWEIAEDEAFLRIVAHGIATALPQLAHSVHVEAAGLQPDRWYWYRFMHGDATSPIGRTRTAPAADVLPASLRLVFASCQDWEYGYFAAHRHMAAAAPDLVAFLGDYIYELGPYDLSHPASPRRQDIESFTLTDYRLRYAQYKSDENLQALHHAAPWLVTWDDHEVADDYANDRDVRRDPNFLARRAAAYQAFYEHMPIRLPPLPTATGSFTNLRIYDRYDWGRLARFHVLDTRQYRSHLACMPADRNGAALVRSACAERQAPSRSLLGAAQEAWLNQGLAGSQATWNILAQQTLMAQLSQTSFDDPGERVLSNDAWDGYAATRSRLFGSLIHHRPANPLVISGDVHVFYAADLQSDFNRPAAADNPVIATEFCGASMTSPAQSQARTDQTLAQNSHIHYGRSDSRGFAAMEITPAQTSVHFHALNNVWQEDSALKTLASFVVQDGRPGVQWAS